MCCYVSDGLDWGDWGLGVEDRYRGPGGWDG